MELIFLKKSDLDLKSTKHSLPRKNLSGQPEGYITDSIMIYMCEYLGIFLRKKLSSNANMLMNTCFSLILRVFQVCYF